MGFCAAQHQVRCSIFATKLLQEISTFSNHNPVSNSDMIKPTLCRMDDAAQAEIAATITQRLYGDFALREATGSAQCSE